VTAYCQGKMTASGAPVKRGIAAADPQVFPMGSSVRVSGLPGSYNGIYQVLDTGSKVRGRHLDLNMSSCPEARRFGRRTAMAALVSRGS
jgi:3D (Asp-Asp-Asp) domain-containing protein